LGSFILQAVSRCPREPARFAPLLLFLFVAVCYANSFQGVFQFDDYKVIVDFPVVHSLPAWWADIGHGLRPLLKLSYTLNWVSGMGVSGFHLLNLALHLASALLVYRLCSLSFPQRPDIALVAALLFAVHPLATEAVTYISGRSMSLMTVFYLASLLAYLKGARAHDKSWLYIWSPLLFLLAVASKETALLLPLSLLLWELCFSRPLGLAALMKRQAVHWLLFVFAALAIVVNEQYWQMLMVSAQINSVQANFLTQLHAMSYLLGQLLMPWNMNIDPDLPAIGSWSRATPDLLLWLSLMAIGLCSWRKRPWLCFAIFWFALHLLPLHVFLPRYDVANDRHLYLAGWSLLLPIAALLGQLRYGLRAAAVAALLLGLSALSISRNHDYRSEIALWESTAKLSPNKSRPYNNLGYAYYLAGRNQEAERAYRTAIRLDPGNLRAQNNLARLKAHP
jgi:hypothetical protein